MSFLSASTAGILEARREDKNTDNKRQNYTEDNGDYMAISGLNSLLVKRLFRFTAPE